MKTVAFILFVTGLLAGPAYWVYAKFFTGSRAALLDLERSAETKGSSWRSPAFRLHAEMAPVGLILHAQGSFAPNLPDDRPPRDRYAATLFRDAEAARPLEFSLGVKSVADANPVFKEHLLYFKQVQAGDYRLEITPLGESRIELGRMQLEVRRQVHEPDHRIVTTGMVLMILGLLGFFL